MAHIVTSTAVGETNISPLAEAFTRSSKDGIIPVSMCLIGSHYNGKIDGEMNLDQSGNITAHSDQERFPVRKTEAHVTKFYGSPTIPTHTQPVQYHGRRWTCQMFFLYSRPADAKTKGASHILPKSAQSLALQCAVHLDTGFRPSPRKSGPIDIEDTPRPAPLVGTLPPVR